MMVVGEAHTSAKREAEMDLPNNCKSHFFGLWEELTSVIGVKPLDELSALNELRPEVPVLLPSVENETLIECQPPWRSCVRKLHRTGGQEPSLYGTSPSSEDPGPTFRRHGPPH
jgi:hypothetical protein